MQHQTLNCTNSFEVPEWGSQQPSCCKEHSINNTSSLTLNIAGTISWCPWHLNNTTNSLTINIAGTTSWCPWDLNHTTSF